VTAFDVTRATLTGLKDPLWRGKVWHKRIHGPGSRGSFWGQATFLVRSLPWARTHLRRVGFRRRTIPFAVRSAVTGYLLQDASASDVVAAVRAVFRGEAVCPPQTASPARRWKNAVTKAEAVSKKTVPA
jgi:hypothetical protein